MKTTLLSALLAILSLVAAGCGSDAETTVTGASDPIVDVSQNPIPDDVSEQSMEETASGSRNRIVSLSPTATEMLFAIGAGDQVIAVDAFSYYPEEAPVTDLSGFEPNVEAIAGFEPTVVVSESPIEGLDAIDIENLVQLAAVTFDDVYSQIEQLGALTGKVSEAAELVLEMQTDIDVVLASLPGRETPLTYYHELDNTLYSVTSTTFVGEVYSLLGLVNAADAADPDGEFFGYPQLNEEFLVRADPDIIFLADTLCCAQNAETVADRPGWDQLSAVQSGNVVELNDDIVSRWGPRLVDFIETAGAAVASVEAVPAG
jgi:iron complex transport system substrate-binding protein